MDIDAELVEHNNDISGTLGYHRISDVLSVNLSVGKFQQLKLKVWRRLYVPFRFLLWRKLHMR
jgi:hypothetical protein